MFHLESLCSQHWSLLCLWTSLLFSHSGFLSIQPFSTRVHRKYQLGSVKKKVISNVKFMISLSLSSSCLPLLSSLCVHSERQLANSMTSSSSLPPNVSGISKELAEVRHLVQFPEEIACILTEQEQQLYQRVRGTCTQTKNIEEYLLCLVYF